MLVIVCFLSNTLFLPTSNLCISFNSKGQMQSFSRKRQVSFAPIIIFFYQDLGINNDFAKVDFIYGSPNWDCVGQV